MSAPSATRALSSRVLNKRRNFDLKPVAIRQETGQKNRIVCESLTVRICAVRCLECGTKIFHLQTNMNGVSSHTAANRVARNVARNGNLGSAGWRYCD